jgi:asparagine synthase (glutamine-hydrolysing)
LEQESYLRDTLLRDTDVMGMAHGVEIRAPYLDPEVLGATSRLGTAAILDPKKPPKWVLRDGWMGELDLRILNRPKTGFTLNMAQWLRGPATQLLKEAKAGLASRSCLDQRVLGRVWSAWEPRLESDHPGAWVPLFALVQLNEQFRRWGEVS